MTDIIKVPEVMPRAGNLRATLDGIDQAFLREGAGPYCNFKIAEAHGQWRKGWAIIKEHPEARTYEGKRGGDKKSIGVVPNDFSWDKLADETGRSDKSLKAWVKLAVEIHEGEAAFRTWATEQRDRFLGQLERKLLPAPTAETPPMPARKFKIIYADPPWKYDFSETESRAIEDKYPTMELEAIKALPIRATENAVLFLWATAPKIREALEVLAAWGFEYKSHAIWDKEIIGMGYWFRGRHELLLVGTKGKGISPPDEAVRPASIFKERRGKIHSRKPEAAYVMIEAMFPGYKKKDRIELFAQVQRKDWTSWPSELVRLALSKLALKGKDV